MPNMFDMLRQANAMKEKMAELQKELESRSFTGSAGNGAVKVTVNGKHEVQKVEISRESLENGPKLEGWIKEALNDAGRRVNDSLKADMSKMTGGLLPGLF